jgi:hypothetical protein
MDKLQKIASLCKCSVTLEYREFSRVYETLKENIDDGLTYVKNKNFLDGELEKCLETDRYWCLQFYPQSPVGFYYAFSNDLDKLFDWALEVIEKKLKGDAREDADTTGIL